jgi:Zn-finger nucleic acid-binding protein
VASFARSTERTCPRCRDAVLARRTFDDIAIESCPRCRGAFVDTVSFERVIRARGEIRSLELPPDPPASAGRSADFSAYVRCPECNNLMNRYNYARISGVIVDICRAHGIWFDRAELAGVIEFVRAGGLERSKRREVEDVESRRRSVSAELSRRPVDVYTASPRWSPLEPSGLDVVFEVLGGVVTDLVDW